MIANEKSSRIIYLASHNQHKLEELRELLSGLPVEIRLANELKNNINWEETGTTFRDNARIKARTVKANTSDCVLADDSGLEVAALSGAPGVYSARYAGEDATDEKNNEKLLEALSGVQERDAQFTCCLCFIDESGDESFFYGHLKGAIAETSSGHHGFGYDPLFLVNGSKRSLASMLPEEKNNISHRYEAVSQLKEFLAE